MIIKPGVAIEQLAQMKTSLSDEINKRLVENLEKKC